MTHIICRAMTCLFWGEGICTAEEIEYEPDVGCLTFQDLGDLELEAEDGNDGLEWEEDSAGGVYDGGSAGWDDSDEDWDDEEETDL
ncbi:hypothetical protein ACFLWA_04700 [Chloroflexota bacterium]